MRLRQISALTALLLPALSAADTLGVRAGANYWNYDISGTARYKSPNTADDIDINRELGYDDGSSGYYYISLEHPVPFLPNVRLSYTKIDDDARGRLSHTVVFGDLTFFVNENVASEFKLEQTDITLYYSLLDNVANIDLGVNAKYIDSSASVTGSLSGREDTDVSGWVPMAYAGVGFDLPLTGLAVAAQGAYIKYDSSSFYDFSAGAEYTTPWRLGVSVGYRKIKLDLDDFDDSFADVEFDGPYAGVYLHF